MPINSRLTQVVLPAAAQQPHPSSRLTAAELAALSQQTHPASRLTAVELAALSQQTPVSRLTQVYLCIVGRPNLPYAFLGGSLARAEN